MLDLMPVWVVTLFLFGDDVEARVRGDCFEAARTGDISPQAEDLDGSASKCR